jgi:hypothetical protein
MVGAVYIMKVLHRFGYRIDALEQESNQTLNGGYKTPDEFIAKYQENVLRLVPNEKSKSSAPNNLEIKTDRASLVMDNKNSTDYLIKPDPSYGLSEVA